MPLHQFIPLLWLIPTYAVLVIFSIGISALLSAISKRRAVRGMRRDAKYRRAG